jgi:hypothetical protein
MANILFTRLCREMKKDEQTGKNLLMGESDKLAWMNSGVGFVLAVYWLGYIGERFSLSYALMDEADNILAHPPTMECEFIGDEINLSTANFYTAFPHAGSYHVNIYQNGICAKTIPVHVIESQRRREKAAYNDESV